MARRQTRSRTPSKKAAAATAQKKTTSKKKGNDKKYLLENISELYTDPTFIFFFFCALVPAIKDGDIMKFVKFATSPILIFCYVLTYCVWTWAHNGKTVKLTKEQRRACYWYLLNGIVFHFLMDFAVGTLKLEDTLGINYFKMDKRYGCVEKFMQSPGEDCPHESGYIFILTWLEVRIVTWRIDNGEEWWVRKKVKRDRPPAEEIASARGRGPKSRRCSSR